MTRTYILIYSLLFCCNSLLWSIPAESAQECLPVVYAFRHAEDFGTNLTAVGRQHADIYESMVDAFGAAHNYCPVGFVYSMYETNPNNSPGTNNPYQTAQPLAIIACYNSPLVSSEYLATCNFFPRTALAHGGKLYEYLGEKPSEQGSPRGGKSATSSALRDELIDNARGGLSSAIFWSSQGLNVLGQAIAGTAKVDIPGCSVPPPDGTKCPASKGVAPRNAAYVFEFNGSNAFDLITPADTYVQCFDVQIKKVCAPGDPKATPPTLDGPPTEISGKTVYWCGNGIDGTGNLPATEYLTPKCEQTLPSTFKNLDNLRGKICDVSNGGPPGYYGYCE